MRDKIKGRNDNQVHNTCSQKFKITNFVATENIDIITSDGFASMLIVHIATKARVSTLERKTVTKNQHRRHNINGHRDLSRLFLKNTFSTLKNDNFYVFNT